jgi:hypothetical protein
MVDRRKGKEKKTVQIPGQKKKYNKPFLMDYGSIEKLTQAGGISIHEKGGTFRRG